MTRTEAVQALLSGKEIVGAQGYRARFNPLNGFEKFENGEWVSQEFNFFGHRYELYNPNPHKPGTFDWAEFEYKAGRMVTTPSTGFETRRREFPWEWYHFTVNEFRSTTWKVVE